MFASFFDPKAASPRGRYSVLAAIFLASVVLVATLSAAHAAAPPDVTGLSPNSGTTAGGNSVIVSGTGFTNATSVLFGTSSTAFSVNNDSQITATAPAVVNQGAVYVRVTTINGTSAVAAANLYLYTAAAVGPSISGLTPNGGPTTGGNSVTITGSGFTGATAVAFGSTGATFSVSNDNQIMTTAPASASSGQVSVRVTTPSGTSAISGGSLYTYGAVTVSPSVTALNPASGPVYGGNTVILTGSGFTGATSVLFGTAGAAFTVNADSQITAIAPAATSSGVVYVRVTNSLGTSPISVTNQYAYSGSVSTGPFISALTPSSGPIGGGTTVIITGSGFTGATSVTFGGVAALFAVNSDEQITAIAPAASGSGTVYVNVTTPAGSSIGSAANQYSYLFGAAGPVVSALTPPSGPTGGGNTVMLNGVGFTGASSVAFGPNAAYFTVNSDIQITATAPAGSGSVYVRVTTPLGTSLATTSNLYAYVSSSSTRPSVTSISPNSGPTSGGTTITVYGSGFTGATSVLFGPVGATFSVVSDSQITVVSPAHAAGPIGIGVYTPAGVSDNTTADDFTYVAAGPPPPPPQLSCPAIPLWTNDLAYGSIGGGFYWDPVSGLVWTGQRGWHLFAPQPRRPFPQPLWVNALGYGSAGGGFYWDPVSGQVWTAERGWHLYSPQGCIH